MARGGLSEDMASTLRLKSRMQRVEGRVFQGEDILERTRVLSRERAGEKVEEQCGKEGHGRREVVSGVVSHCMEFGFVLSVLRS